VKQTYGFVADEAAMKNPSVDFKNRTEVIFIVVGAIILAIPICFFGLIKVLWELGMSVAEPRRPIVAEKIRALAEAAEVHISGRDALPRNSPLSNVPNNPSELP
jgi:hypothetical protein